MLGPLQKIHMPMRRFAEGEEVDYLIVGCGSAGGVLLQRLARAGFKVVALEAGPFLGYRARLGLGRVRLARTLLGRTTRYRRHRSAGTGSQ